MIWWGSIMILVLSVVPFLFLNNWFNLIKIYNKSILLKSGLYIIISIIIYIIINAKFGYRNVDDLVSVADSFFEYIKNSFIFRYVKDGGLLANVEKPFHYDSKISTSVIAVIVCIAYIFIFCICIDRLENDRKTKDGTFSIVFNFSLSVIFAVTIVLMFIFKEKSSTISLILLILFTIPLVMRIIKLQHERKVYILQDIAILSTILFSTIFAWQYVVYVWIFLAVCILAMPFALGGIGGGSSTDPQPTGLEKQRKKISAIQGELYDGEWTYKDGYITSSDGFTKRKVVDSDISGKVITDEYGEKHVQMHSSEID